ncbi:anti-sigma factor [Microbacterium alcoholitolerans]|uniref:anti-sigma factor n=1 Tax=unclassified Microbacterium TaxID=2609290 RepID=UPI003D17A33C
MNEQEFSELAAGHALHALSDADEQRFQAALVAHPEWQHLVDADEQTAAALADSVPPVAPPAGLRDALLAQIAAASQGVPSAQDAALQTTDAVGSPSGGAVAADAAAGGRRWSRMLFALAACLVLLVGAGIGTAVVVSQLQRPQSVVALEQIQDAGDARQQSVELASGGTVTAHWSDELGKAVLVTTGLDDPGQGETYELWLVRGEVPIAAGVFDPADGEATALLAEPMRPGDAIAVTVEQAGGSPSGAPTSDPILVIPTA